MPQGRGLDAVERRRFLLGAGALAVSSACVATPSRAQSPVVKADHRLVIAPVSLEIAPGHVIRTIGYNGTVPGPLLRMRERSAVTIAVTNNSDADDIVHWHGLHIPSNVDGAMEEGTPMVMPGETRLYRFVAKPTGTRWYHSHAMAGKDLSKSLYSGQYGFIYVEPRNDAGRYDQEVFIAMHHWEPYFVSLQDVRKGPPPDNGLEVAYKSASFNGKALGHGEPVRVREGQRVLFRLLNASATRDVMLALPGHRFEVVALDGNPVPTSQTLDALFLAPGERIDAVVTMDHPGVFVLGAVDDDDRAMGMGIVVEYAGATGEPQWQAMAMKMNWSYVPFGRASGAPAPEPDERIELLLQKIPGGRGGFNRWTINGKSWPDTDPLVVKKGKRYRLVLHNLSGDMHPIHLHRHSFELTNFLGKPVSGVVKDVFALPGRRDAEIDFVADNPGPSLFHCHMQDHQDFGFMALVKYV
jgi:FtsP/CotA-like multicopper oxidase with cupredoxin domain